MPSCAGTALVDALLASAAFLGDCRLVGVPSPSIAAFLAARLLLYRVWESVWREWGPGVTTGPWGCLDLPVRRLMAATRPVVMRLTNFGRF